MIIRSAFALLLALACACQPSQPREQHASFYLLADVYEIVPPNGDARRSPLGVAAALRNANPTAPLLFAGDAISPSLLSSSFEGRPMIEALNACNVTVMTFGNHEFDYGLAVLRQRIKDAKFQWVVSNVRDPATGRPFEGTVESEVFLIDGIKVAVIGLMHKEVLSAAEGAEMPIVDDPMTVAAALNTRLRSEGADVVLALTHLTLELDRELARTVPIDAVLGGHDHVPLITREAGRLIVKPGTAAQYLGRVDVHRIGERVFVEASLEPVTGQVPAHPEVVAIAQRYEQQLSSKMDEPLGETLIALDASDASLRTGTTNMGNFVADVLRAATHADLALVNSGGIRGDRTLPPGALTQRDIGSLLPFGNRVVVLEVTTDELRSWVEHGVAKLPALSGRFPQISGFEAHIDPAAPPGSRVKKLVVGGREPGPGDKFELVTNQFLAGGGDGYPKIGRHGEGVDSDADFVWRLVANAVKMAGKIDPPGERRVIPVAAQ